MQPLQKPPFCGSTSNQLHLPPHQHHRPFSQLIDVPMFKKEDTSFQENSNKKECLSVDVFGLLKWRKG
jgi:hypothetical protein